MFAGSATALGCELNLAGQASQGGMIRGETEPGAQVWMDGGGLTVAPDGGFVFGFGRDHIPWTVIEARCADGSRARTTVQIAQRDYPEQRIDGLPQRTVTPDPDDVKRIRADAARVRAARAQQTARTDYRDGFIWPALGPITGVYGSVRILNGEPRAPHFGVDVGAPRGTAVAAAAPGQVILAENLFLSGNTVIIDHGYGITSSYLHLDDITVAAGAEVAQGAEIGHLGASGRATGPHLDWRINWFDERLDPALIAGPMPEKND